MVVETALGIRDPELNSVARYRPHPYLNYVGNPDHLTADGELLHHRIGIRATEVDLDAKPEGVFRVVAVGGSTTFGLYVPETRKVWPGLVGMALEETFGSRVETVNAGFRTTRPSSWSSRPRSGFPRWSPTSFSCTPG